MQERRFPMIVVTITGADTAKFDAAGLNLVRLGALETMIDAVGGYAVWRTQRGCKVSFVKTEETGDHTILVEIEISEEPDLLPKADDIVAGIFQFVARTFDQPTTVWCKHEGRIIATAASTTF